MNIDDLMLKTGADLTAEELIALLKYRSKGGKKDAALMTDKETTNVINLRQHSEAIYAGFDRILKDNGVDMFMYKFVLRDEIVTMPDGNRGYPCCCANGWNVADCDDCWWIEYF